MKTLPALLLLGFLLTFAQVAPAADGLVQVQSPYTVKQTVARFISTAKGHGLKIFARVDHAAGAESVDMKLRPTTVVIFGNPKAGTPFMQCRQTVGIDLPMKALIWRDANGQVWLGYNDPKYIARRHGARHCPAVAPIGKALAGLAGETVSADE